MEEKGFFFSQLRMASASSPATKGLIVSIIFSSSSETGKTIPQQIKKKLLYCLPENKF